MEEHYNKIKGYVLDLNYSITSEDQATGVMLISNESEGISNLVIGCSPPIMIMEQHIVDIKGDKSAI